MLNNNEISHSKLVEDVKFFCNKHGISTTEFGLRLFNDTAFFGKLSRGTSPTLARVEKVYKFMSDYEQNVGGGVDDICS